ncbi:MAG: hypothetical protein JXQ80_01305, partial [Bacteroidales bacterium]|nr:hypothetical protein [Bacteroidales bacterium]
FIKWTEFSDHLSLLLNHTPILAWSLVFLTLSTLLYLLRGQKKPQNTLQLQMNLGLIALVVLQYLMASKHFAYHYMNPSLLLTLFVILMTVETLRLVFQQAGNTIIYAFLGITALVIMLHIVPVIPAQLKHMQSVSTVKYKAWQQLKPALEAKPLIVSPSYYGCSALEYALTYGIQVSGRHADFLTERVKKLYPATYMYFPWGKVFYEGRNEIDPVSFMNPGLTFTLYIADDNPGKLDDILSLVKTSVTPCELAVTEVIKLPETAESVYSLRFVSRAPADTLVQRAP